MKVCTICQVEQPLDRFYRDKSRPDGRTHRCKQCDSKKAYTWKLANPDSARKQGRDWHAANRDRGRATRAASDARRRVALAARNRERRARAATGMTLFDRVVSREYRILLVGRPCFYCGRVKSRMENDHFFAIDHGGSDHWWNLVRSCHTCNRRKSVHCGTWALLMRDERWADDDQGETDATIGRPRKRKTRAAAGSKRQRSAATV